MKKLLQGLNPLRHFDFEMLGISLSGRVLWLTVGIILAVEMLILVPNLGQERQSWLWQHVTQAHLAAFSVDQAGGGAVDAPERAALLQLADVESIKLIEPGRTLLVLQDGSAMTPGQVVYLDQESVFYSSWRAARRLLGIGTPQLEVIAPSPLEPGAVLAVVVNGDELNAYLRNYVIHIAALSFIIALVTGLLVFAALDRMLVQPMQIITASIAGFRRNPEEHAGPDELSWLAERGNDEVANAAKELKVMQEELREALWRNARLAAVGTAVAKISHDLRNILSSALLVADRLEDATDPVVKHAARTLIPAVERAAQLVTRTVDFAREGPPAITRTNVNLTDLVDEAAAMMAPGSSVAVENKVPASMMMALDRTQIYRVLVNLMRNAAEAGATGITVSAAMENGVTRMELRDNGPGLPQKVQDNLFRPFTGSGRQGGTGLGLVIARDLVRAHGGDLVMAQTGPQGTLFAMELAAG